MSGDDLVMLRGTLRHTTARAVGLWFGKSRDDGSPHLEFVPKAKISASKQHSDGDMTVVIPRWLADRIGEPYVELLDKLEALSSQLERVTKRLAAVEAHIGMGKPRH